MEKILNIKNIAEENKANDVKEKYQDIVDKEEIQTLKKLKSDSIKVFLEMDPKDLQQV